MSDVAKTMKDQSLFASVTVQNGKTQQNHQNSTEQVTTGSGTVLKLIDLYQNRFDDITYYSA